MADADPNSWRAFLPRLGGSGRPGPWRGPALAGSPGESTGASQPDPAASDPPDSRTEPGGLRRGEDLADVDGRGCAVRSTPRKTTATGPRNRSPADAEVSSGRCGSER